jgi:hypothetical protein
MQLPLLHLPCGPQAGHCGLSHVNPVQPALQAHLPFSHRPLAPQAGLQTSTSNKKQIGHIFFECSKKNKLMFKFKLLKF